MPDEQIRESLWERNITLVGQHSPTLAQWLKKDGKVRAPSEEIPTPFSTEELQFFVELSTVDWVHAVVLGFGDGRLVRRMAEMYPNRGIYVIETEPENFRAAASRIDFAPIFRNPWFQIALVLKPQALTVAKQVFDSIADYLEWGTILTCSLPGYLERHESFWEEFGEHLGLLSRMEAVNAVTYRKHFVNWQRNIWANLPYASRDPGIDSLFGQFENVPAIVVASGPSLDKNIHELRRAKGKALILAAGSAVGPLLAAGITPDLVLTTDGSAQNAEPFADIDDPDLPLVYTGIVTPEVPSRWRGPRFVMSSDAVPLETWVYEQIDQPKGVITSGPSVANTTFDLAVRMGCNPIIFVGLDLALTDGSSHAVGARSIDLVQSDDAQDQNEWVMGVNGERLRTTLVMQSMRGWFEGRIRHLQYERQKAGLPPHRVIDATEGGARIAETEILSLATVIDTYCGKERKVGERLIGLHRAGQPITNGQAQSLSATVRDNVRSIRDTARQFARPLKQLRKMEHNGRTLPKVRKAAERLEALNGELESNGIYANCFSPVTQVYRQNYRGIRRNLKKVTSAEDTLRLSVALYDGYHETVIGIADAIEEMVQKK